ncbi:MAG: immunoglobulin-like domain-containing protein [Bacteroidales bacterium]|jgi:major membrane immunogen (membrane-anchored lipoprotein)
MKYIVSLLTLVLVFSLLHTGCKKKDEGDGTKPVIIIIGANPTYHALNIPYIDIGAIAFDISSTGDTTDLTSSVVVQDNVDVATTGEYRVTYNVKDDSGLAADERIRIVKVVNGK